MIRRIICIAVLAFASSTLVAQTSKVDLFGGYSYVHSGPGFGLPSGNASGWEATLSYNWNRWLSLEADFDGHYCCDQTMHDFLFGPRINLGHGKLKPFAHGLMGVSHGTSTGGFSDTVLAFAGGGGLDWKVGDRVSVRLFQADYLGTRYADATQNHFRLSAGLVFHFGNR